MNNIWLAIIASSILSILLSFIQITSDSRIFIIKCYFTLTFLFYVLISIVGNILTTLLSASIVDSYISSRTDETMLLQGPAWIWYAAFGVFGFEALIQKINVTFFDKDVLSINDWLTKAKKSATSAILEKYADLKTERTQMLAYQLAEVLDDQSIHTLASKQLGNERYTRIVQAAQNNANINLPSYLAHMLADEVPKVIKAEIKARK